MNFIIISLWICLFMSQLAIKKLDGMLLNDHLVSICHYKPCEECQTDWNGSSKHCKKKDCSLYISNLPAWAPRSCVPCFLHLDMWFALGKGYDEQQPQHGLWICFIFLHIPSICHYNYIINEWLYCQQLTTEMLLSPIVQRREKRK